MSSSNARARTALTRLRNADRHIVISSYRYVVFRRRAHNRRSAQGVTLSVTGVAADGSAISQPSTFNYDGKVMTLTTNRARRTGRHAGSACRPDAGCYNPAGALRRSAAP